MAGMGTVAMRVVGGRGAEGGGAGNEGGQALDLGEQSELKQEFKGAIYCRRGRVALNFLKALEQVVLGVVAGRVPQQRARATEQVSSEHHATRGLCNDRGPCDGSGRVVRRQYPAGAGLRTNRVWGVGRPRDACW